MASKYQVVIGRFEEIDIVNTALKVPAKIDTGAFRSSIHASDIKIIEKKGQEILTCKLLGHPCSPVRRDFESAKFSKVNVTNSFGKDEERHEVPIKIKLGPKIFYTSFTLADRSNNLFPVLVGRKLLKGKYLVDAGKTSIDRSRLKKTFGIKSTIDEEDLED